MPLNGAVHLFAGDRRSALDRPHIVGRFEPDFSPAIRVTERIFDPSFVFAEVNLTRSTARGQLGDALLTEWLKPRHRASPPDSFVLLPTEYCRTARTLARKHQVDTLLS